MADANADTAETSHAPGVLFRKFARKFAGAEPLVRTVGRLAPLRVHEAQEYADVQWRLAHWSSIETEGLVC
jgi:hypothetical protein